MAALTTLTILAVSWLPDSCASATARPQLGGRGVIVTCLVGLEPFWMAWASSAWPM